VLQVFPNEFYFLTYAWAKIFNQVAKHFPSRLTAHKDDFAIEIAIAIS